MNYQPTVCGGSVSDRIFIERGKVPELCDPKDSIMVDKGFDVQDLFASYDVRVDIPTFLQKGNQLNIVKLRRDGKMQAKRSMWKELLAKPKHIKYWIGLSTIQRLLWQKESYSVVSFCATCVLTSFRNSMKYDHQSKVDLFSVR